MAPVISELVGRGLPHTLVHTGQHYDEKMSAIFIDQLIMPRPDVKMFESE
jgi:UDP-N-acetylglucosamine 2-epimerase (non-hydrolysing)